MSDESERSVASAGSVADIIDRLLAAVKADAPIQRALVVSAAAEIERLRFAIRRLADQDATLSVRGGNVIVTMDATLTDAEREAIAEMALVCEGREKRSLEWQLPEEAVHWRGMAETLRGLLAARSETANV